MAAVVATEPAKAGQEVDPALKVARVVPATLVVVRTLGATANLLVPAPVAQEKHAVLAMTDVVHDRTAITAQTVIAAAPRHLIVATAVSAPVTRPSEPLSSRSTTDHRFPTTLPQRTWTSTRCKHSMDWLTNSSTVLPGIW